MQNVTIDRNKYIGGSDIPIILGISPFKKRFELLLEKAELETNDFKGNSYTEYGNAMEDKIRDYVNETLYPKTHFKEDMIIDGYFRGHADGTNKDFVLEIKTTSMIHENLDEYKTYLVQLLKYMELFKKEKGVLAVYFRDKAFNEEFESDKLQIFMVDINNYKDLLKQINEACEQFMVDLEKVKENPFLTEEELLPADLTKQTNEVLRLEEQLATFKKLEKQYNEEKENLRQLMIKNNCKNWETPNGTKITLVADGKEKIETITKYDEEKFEEENKEIVSMYNNACETYEEAKNKYSYTENIIKKGRKGYVKITLPKEI